MNPVVVDLPKVFGIWTRSDEIRRIVPAKIFDYMDGAGELYLGYRFNHLEVAKYSAPGEDQILVEIYRMDSSDDAFGLLSGDWGGEAVNLEESAVKQIGPMWLHNVRALYGAGLLRIWSGNIYARVMAYRESPRSKEAVLQLGRLIQSARKTEPPPAFLGVLPELTGGFRLRADRFCYFRSHLVLNSVYFLSAKNILDLDRSAEAVTASYVPRPGTATSRSVQLIMVRYADADAAGKALAHFEQAYLPEKSKVAAKSSPGGDQFQQIEDGWMGYGRHGRFLILVFECPQRDSAVQFVNDCVKRLNILEVRHE